jgi:hypothetical protein
MPIASVTNVRHGFGTHIVLDGAVNGQDLGILLGAWGPCA